MATKATTKKKTVTKTNKEPEDTTLSVFSEAGGAGLKRFGGIIEEEYQAELKGSKAAIVYREMADNNVALGAILYLIELLLQQSEYDIEPADDTPAAIGVANIIQDNLEEIHGGMCNFMTEFSGVLQYGWAVWEKVYYRNTDGYILLKKLAPRSQDSLFKWEFDDVGNVTHFIQKPAPDFDERILPIEKCLHVTVRGRKGNPEGRSIFRHIYSEYYIRKHLQIIQAIGIERNLAGLPVYKIPPQMMSPNASAEEQAIRANAEEFVQRVRRDELQGLVLPNNIDQDGNPTGYDFGLLAASGASPIDSEPVMQRLDTSIAMGVLADFMRLGQTNVGSYALHDDKSSLFAMAIGALLDTRDEAFNRQVLPELCELNGWDTNLIPKMKRRSIEKTDVTAFSGALTQLVGAGIIVPDDKLEEYARELVNAPIKDATTAVQDTQTLPAYGAL